MSQVAQAGKHPARSDNVDTSEKREIPVKTYDLVSLLSKVTPENIQEAVDFGPPVGKEIW